MRVVRVELRKCTLSRPAAGGIWDAALAARQKPPTPHVTPHVTPPSTRPPSPPPSTDLRVGSSQLISQGHRVCIRPPHILPYSLPFFFGGICKRCLLLRYTVTLSVNRQRLGRRSGCGIHCLPGHCPTPRHAHPHPHPPPPSHTHTSQTQQYAHTHTMLVLVSPRSPSTFINRRGTKRRRHTYRQREGE